MIGRRALVATFAAGSLLAPLRARTQYAGRLRRIGVLVGASPATAPHLFQAFETYVRRRQIAELALRQNRQTARALGIEFPRSLMLQVTRVIE